MRGSYRAGIADATHENSKDGIREAVLAAEKGMGTAGYTRREGQGGFGGGNGGAG